MNRLVSHHLSRSLRLCGIVVALAVFAPWAGTTLEASCGDWLDGHAIASGQDNDASARGDSSFGDAASKPADSGPRRRPCSGPSCGRAPSLPLVPTELPQVRVDLDRAALLGGLDPIDPATAGSWLVTDEPRFLSALSGRPERPPRGA